MKYLVFIHSSPVPWGHPTSDHLAAFQALPAEQRESMGAAFDALLDELSASGELVGGHALGDPAAARLHRWSDGEVVVTDGPYSRTGEHLAGMFVLDVATPERAAALAARFAGPGETIELRATA